MFHKKLGIHRKFDFLEKSDFFIKSWISKEIQHFPGNQGLPRISRTPIEIHGNPWNPIENP